MAKVKNTEKKEVHSEWLMGGNPGAIEAQEARGQEELVESLQLPRICNSPSGVNAAEQYHKMGIKVFTTSKDDNLFMGTKLPNGWKKEATDHPMWSNLVDDKGQIRATIFYKASFYDRDSFINFRPRYYSSFEYVEGSTTHEKYMCVKDHVTGEELFKTAIYTGFNDTEYKQECANFLEENYPYHKDLNAYW